MTCFTTHQLRALSAAAGVVGRPHLRAGLLLTLAVACGTSPSDAADSSSGEPDPATTSTTLASTTTSAELTTSGASGDASTTSSDTTSTTLAPTSTDSTTTSSDETTGDTTLLTEFTSTTSTTDEPGTGAGTTGGLDDCIDPRTQDIDWVCCEAQDWQPAPQCTPWGPPAPPSLTRDLLARARAARQELA